LADADDFAKPDALLLADGADRGGDKVLDPGALHGQNEIARVVQGKIRSLGVDARRSNRANGSLRAAKARAVHASADFRFGSPFTDLKLLRSSL
jgi:hypothetical protein